ncbi:MAG: hypothetical protein ABIL86_11955 [candidate division WOR-3 bacterium]
MRGIKINKIAALWLFIMLFIRFGQGTKEQLPLHNYIDGEMYIVGGGYPKVGEVFEIVFRVRVKETVDWTLQESYLRADYFAVISVSTYGAEIVGKDSKDKFFFSGLQIGETKEFRTRCRILNPVNWIRIIGYISLSCQGKERGPVAKIAGINLYLVDPETGQYGTKEEYEKRLRQQAEWWYDPAGEFTSEPVSPDCAERNRGIIAQLKKLEPNLTSWEALYLHYDGIQALMGGMGDAKTTWEDRWKFLLEMGWLEKQRAGKEIKEKWLKELIEKYKGRPLIKEQGLDPNFFRDNDNGSDNYSNSSDSTKENRWSYFCFNGQFRYKKTPLQQRKRTFNPECRYANM